MIRQKAARHAKLLASEYELSHCRSTQGLRWVSLAVCFLALTPLALVAQQDRPSDQEITDRVEDEFLMDSILISTQIDVETSKGIVTLSGSVNNILAKERAVRIAETVRGVRSVINQIAVRPAAERSDQEIRTDVEKALLTDPATDSYEVESAVTNGVVTLTGTVDSYQERELAAKVAKGVRGVRDLVNYLEVDYDTDRSDSEIKKEVEKTLQWNTLIDDALIDVEVDDGEVTLDGIVGSAAEKTQVAFASWVAGVSSVDDSDLKVDRWMRDEELRGNKYVVKPDAEIRQAVVDALLYDPRVSSFNIDVEVSTGTVTLRGEVDNLKAKRVAADNARNTVGVANVENRIKVRTNGEIDDQEIAQDVRAALSRSPMVHRFDITVHVSRGTVYLYGAVDSYVEKLEADNVASKIQGVRDVQNYLTVADSHPLLFDPYVDTYPYNYDWYDYEPSYTTRSDDEIQEEIKEELWWSPFVDSDDVNVHVDDGIVTLTGTVTSWSERSSATENAFEGGATWVDNDLKVSPTK